MRLSAWFAVVRCYGLNGYHYASHTTIAQESGQLNIQMSPKRAHFEKKVGICILGYSGEFNKNVKREVEKTFHKLQKGEREMAGRNQNSEDEGVQNPSENVNLVVEVEAEKNELTTSAFQQTVDSIQALIGENLQKANDLNESFRKMQEEKNNLLEKIAKINQQLEASELQTKLIQEGLDYLAGAKETFEKIK